MNLYAESSAVLAWLFGESRESEVVAEFDNAERIFSSDLMLVECDRAIWRAAALGKASQSMAGQWRGSLMGVCSQWEILRLSPQIVDRARQPFPGEPIRTLDALHVASALQAHMLEPALAMLSLDERVRRVAHSVGLPLLPN